MLVAAETLDDHAEDNASVVSIDEQRVFLDHYLSFLLSLAVDVKLLFVAVLSLRGRVFHLNRGLIESAILVNFTSPGGKNSPDVLFNHSFRLLLLLTVILVTVLVTVLGFFSFGIWLRVFFLFDLFCDLLSLNDHNASMETHRLLRINVFHI